ncbi:MAG: hypothetical protein IJQ73_15665 [Kiritimatiellae bacterium]|nr:hypothetical protein [Kiritimatiellia bacterium]
MNTSIATYTAENGLSWFYDKSAIEFAELDRCRNLLGRLPDFDAGDNGYEGVAAVGGRVLVLRCVSAPKWDFLNRDATFLRVVWLDRKDATCVDFGKILYADAFCQLSHDYPHEIEVECAKIPGTPVEAKNGVRRIDFAEVGRMFGDFSQDVLIRHDFGSEVSTVTVKTRGEGIMTEAEKFLLGKVEEPPQQATMGSATRASQANSEAADAGKSVVAPSYGSRILAAIVFLIGLFLGTYLARQTHHEIFGFIVMAAALGIARALWNSGGKHV